MDDDEQSAAVLAQPDIVPFGTVFHDPAEAERRDDEGGDTE